MRGQSLTIVGAIAAVAPAIRALVDWNSGTGLPLLVIAVALAAALLLRRNYPRE